MNSSDSSGRHARVWLPLLIAAVSILTGAGATTATISGRITDAERRIEVIERDRERKLADYQQFKTDVRGDLSEIKTDLAWVRSALQRKGF
jgi:hypothetical protein